VAVPVLAVAAGCTDEEASLAEVMEKVLYFYPPETELVQQIQHVGLCEGLLDLRRWAQCSVRCGRR
jgi:hypothetical protein